jgi:hypothetical protein
MQPQAADLSAHAEARTGAGLPRFTKDEVDPCLGRVILANGFPRLRCRECSHDKRLDFHRKRRGIFP